MKNQEDMRLFELKVNQDGIRCRLANPYPLTGEQKYNLAMAVIIGACVFLVVSSFFALFR